MVRLMPQVAPISPQRRMNRSCEVRSCWAGVGLESVAGGEAVSVAVAIGSPVSVSTESIASAGHVSGGFRGFSENESREKRRVKHQGTKTRSTRNERAFVA